MGARGFAFSSGREPVREGLVVVGEDLLDLEGGGLDELVQKGARGAGRLVLADLQVDPPCRPVDGDKQIAPGAFAGHLRQILDVHMHKARLVVLERLVGLVRSRLALLLAQHRFQVVYAVSPQAAVQRRAAQIGVEELPGHHQQVIEGQQQQFTNRHNNRFLRLGQGGIQPMRTMRAIMHLITTPPLGNGRLGDAEPSGERRIAHARWRRLDLGANLRGGSGVGVDGCSHGLYTASSQERNTSISSRAKNNRSRPRGI